MKMGSRYKDSDYDGVPDSRDCAKYNPLMQDWKEAKDPATGKAPLHVEAGLLGATAKKYGWKKKTLSAGNDWREWKKEVGYTYTSSHYSNEKIGATVILQKRKYGDAVKDELKNKTKYHIRVYTENGSFPKSYKPVDTREEATKTIAGLITSLTITEPEIPKKSK
jgi:hypothetical protein